MHPVEPKTLRLMGVVVRPHGVRGDLVVRPETDDPGRFSELKTIFLGPSREEAEAYTIRSARSHIAGGHQSVILGLESVEDRDHAARTAGMEIFAEEADLPALSPDELYLDELVGMRALSTEQTLLGEVVDVLEAPGQNLLQIRTVAGGEALVPLVPALVSKIDTDARTVVISLIEGLIEAAD